MGIEMRPLITRGSAWAYPWYAGVFGSFGYWLTGVEHRQLRWIERRKEQFLEKKARVEEIERKEAEARAAEGEVVEAKKGPGGFVLGWK